MTDPRIATDYDAGLAAEARRLCLTIATLLGDLLNDLVVVGGLVPYLLVDQRLAEPHVGTRDLDLGLSLALLDQERYADMSQALRREGFKAQTKPNGGVRRCTWVHPGVGVTLDFLMPQPQEGTAPGRLQDLEEDFAAIVTAGLQLAFRDAIDLQLAGETLFGGGAATRTVRVCGPAAFVALKANAVHNRNKLKDAYDLVYVLMHYGGDAGLEEIAARYRALGSDSEADAALARLASDFESPDHVGPVRAGMFQTGRRDPALQADAWGYVQELLRLIGYS